MSQVTGVDITNPQITFYGPYPCDLCGKVVIIRGSVSQGYGGIRLVHPNEPIYPNHNWEAHECGCKFQIGQEVEWDGQEGICVGKITNITNPEPGSYVLSVDLAGTEFYVNASLARERPGSELVKPS